MKAQIKKQWDRFKEDTPRAVEYVRKMTRPWTKSNQEYLIEVAMYQGLYMWLWRSMHKKGVDKPVAKSLAGLTVMGYTIQKGIVGLYERREEPETVEGWDALGELLHEAEKLSEDYLEKGDHLEDQMGNLEDWPRAG